MPNFLYMVYRVMFPFNPYYHPLSFFSLFCTCPASVGQAFFIYDDFKRLSGARTSRQIYFKDVSIIKQITKDDIDILLKKGILHNTNHGYVDRYGNLASYYRTCHKIYIGDKYADLAKKLNK